jgi:Virulence factor
LIIGLSNIHGDLTVAFYQILYWQDIPSQVRAWDDFDEVKIELGPKFVALIDQSAQTQGLTGNDDYLAQWKWGDELEREGDAQDVANALKRELEAKHG